MYTTYALISQKDKTLYIGLTNNIQRRISQHNSGQVKSTKNKRPFNIFYTEQHQTRLKAREREKFLKSGCGREFLKTRLPEW